MAHAQVAAVIAMQVVLKIFLFSYLPYISKLSNINSKLAIKMYIFQANTISIFLIILIFFEPTSTKYNTIVINDDKKKHCKKCHTCLKIRFSILFLENRHMYLFYSIDFINKIYDNKNNKTKVDR